MLLVAFHGGPGGDGNVGAYSDDGHLHTLTALRGADGRRSVLRALQFVAGGLLWVLAGGKGAILALRGAVRSIRRSTRSGIRSTSRLPRRMSTCRPGHEHGR